MGETSTTDGSRVGRQIEVTTTEKIEKIHKTALVGRRMKVNEIAVTVAYQRNECAISYTCLLYTSRCV